MFDKSDPRAALAPVPSAGSPVPATDFAGADYAKFYETAPQLNDPHAKTWLARGQNFVVAFSEVTTGAVFVRGLQVDEYVLLLPDADTRATVTAGGETRTIDGYSITFMPPGASTIAIAGKGRSVRLFSSQSADLVALCSNATSYATPHPNIPPFVAWPAPKEGFKIRSYSLDVPDEPGRFGRIWRGTTMMVNFIPPQMGPRDPKKMSPHYHDDFEQCSLVLEGGYTHHLRWPWTIDMTKWRADDHEYCAAPSVTVIPPPSIHTSEAKAAGLNLLVDIFSPPRMDFSLKPGWVLNCADYPLPTDER